MGLSRPWFISYLSHRVFQPSLPAPRMKIDEALILRLEELARLELSAEERKSLRDDLNAILAMVEKMREVDTDGVEPLTHMTETTNALRSDRVEGQVYRRKALGNAPDSDGKFFRVPKVIDK